MNLIQFLEKNDNTRKIFGQRELKIIEKQLNGINLTQSEKNRLSRDIRKKFQFIKDISKFEDFSLKKAGIIKDIIKETKKIILEDEYVKKIRKIILFGSVIENKLTIRSDIDIAVEFDKISLREATLFRKRVSGQLPDKVDVQVLNVLPKKVKKSILKNHRIL
ncbi:MAG: nucleotidyltransferase domain-containing protein [Nanoarchaeota archaeon]|nr:nucleotidyltransferase domain-containing protein [Nanoarchaeota archaeon]